MAKQMRVSRENRSQALPLMLSITLLAVLAVPFAGLWHAVQGGVREEPPFRPSQVASGPQAGSSDVSSEPEPESESQPPEPVETAFGVPLEKSERVRSEYFDDAMFVGDSITTGVEGYGAMPNAAVVAAVGINLDNIMYSTMLDGPSGKETFLQAMARGDAKKIYIMLGANGLAFLSSEQTADYYRAFLTAVLEQHPQATIYVQSILPIDEALFAKNYQGTLTNAKINEANGLIMEVCGELKVYYLDVAEAFKDENGSLIREATSDGLHFNGNYYTIWMDYLKSHTVQGS